MVISSEQFAIRARSALVSHWPQLGTLNQTEMLDLLKQAYQTAAALVPRKGFASFVPPTVEDVRGYLREIGSDLLAEEFIDFYQSKDWMVGRTPMKDWRSAARRAHRSWSRPTQRNTSGTTTPPRVMTEWERKTKGERLAALRAQLHNLTHPAGSAWPVDLHGEQRQLAQKLVDQIAALRAELDAP